jgi:PAS domain S-box-containing protein
LAGIRGQGNWALMVSQDQSGQHETHAKFCVAIIANADDAIVSVDLNGIITGWNKGSERLLGHTCNEMIGVLLISVVTPDRHVAEQEILARVRRGERVAPYQTVLQHKNGSLVELSVAVSPIKNAAGGIDGTAVIGRASDEVRATHEVRDVPAGEMRHRIRNLFALASGVVGLSARFAQTPEDMADTVRSRLDALARAHDLTWPSLSELADGSEPRATLHALVRTIVSPYDNAEHGGLERVTISGADIPISGGAKTNFALLLHEFATNAAKYGALSLPTGHVDVGCAVAGDELCVLWRERGGPALDGPALREGFGSMLARATVERQFGGSIAREWDSEGLTIRLVVSLARLST